MTARSSRSEARRSPGELPSVPGVGSHCDSRLEAEIAALAGLSRHDLAIAWRRLCRGEPPRGWSRDLLMREIAYRMQERAHGGLTAAVRRRLRTLMAQSADREGAAYAPTRLRTGARLVREWGGQTHTVLVLDDGFDYDGQRFGSLSLVARRITGAHWSGPRFFGLKQRPTAAAGDG